MSNSTLNNTIEQINARAARYAAEDGNVKNALWTAANELGFSEVHRSEDGETEIYQNAAGDMINCWYVGPQSDQITEGGAGFDTNVEWYTQRETVEA